MKAYKNSQIAQVKSQKVKVAQSLPIPGKTMVKNEAGGYVFPVDKWTLLDRFLILGTEGGSYYSSEKELTNFNANNVLDCIAEDGKRVVDKIIEIDKAGKAIKKNQLLFALALCAKNGSLETRRYANSVVDSVCNIGTDILNYANFVNSLGGWGSGTKRSIARWYNKPIDQLVYHLAKYQSRNGFSHRDVLRLTHTTPKNEQYDFAYAWATNKLTYENGKFYRTKDLTEVPHHKFIEGFERIKTALSDDEVCKLITEYNLPRECIPTEFLNSPKVWDMLLQKMPMTATIRNLGKMSSVGILDQRSEGEKIVIERITNRDYIKSAKIHPMTILLALKVYEQGHGEKGSLSWNANRKILDALNKAFYNSFEFVEPSGKSLCLGVDVSGSMGWDHGTIISPAMAAAAMAMVVARTEKDYFIGAFSNKFVELPISPEMSLPEVLKITSNKTFGGTDASIPIEHAMKKKHQFDAFVIYSDGATWAGQQHVCQSLVQYRKNMQINSKLICCNFVANGISIVDPDDIGSLNLIGLDPSIPTTINSFISE